MWSLIPTPTNAFEVPSEARQAHTDKDSEIAGQQGWSCLHMMADKNTGCLKKNDNNDNVNDVFNSSVSVQW